MTEICIIKELFTIFLVKIVYFNIQLNVGTEIVACRKIKSHQQNETPKRNETFRLNNFCE
jgi:hypothetical protein